VRGTLNNPSDKTRLTVEIAFPWKVLAEHARHAARRNEGDIGGSTSRVSNADRHYQRAYAKVPKTPEDNWVWSPQGVVDMHRPEMWGVVQFTSRPASEKHFRRGHSRQIRPRSRAGKSIMRNRFGARTSLGHEFG